MLLSGPSGTGKSLIIHAVCKQIVELCESQGKTFVVISINCEGPKTADRAVYPETEHRQQQCRLPASVRIVGIRCCIEPIDILDSVKIVVKRIQVAKPLGLHIRHNAGIDEGEGFVLAKECLPGREGIGGEGVDVEAGVFFDAIEEIDGCVVAGVGREAVERFREHVVEDDCFRERSVVDAVEHRERGIVGSISPVCGGKEDCRIDECPRHLLDVDAPGVVLARDIGRLLTSVAVEVGERARLLLDHLDSDAPVILELPAELIAIIDIEFTPNPGGDVCLVSRHLAFGVDSVAAHTSR